MNSLNIIHGTKVEVSVWVFIFEQETCSTLNFKLWEKEKKELGITYVSISEFSVGFRRDSRINFYLEMSYYEKKNVQFFIPQNSVKYCT